MFIRVRDKRTRHQFDVSEQAFNPEIHEEIKRVPRSKVPRPAKPMVKRARPKTSTPVVAEGVSPAGD